MADLTETDKGTSVVEFIEDENAIRSFAGRRITNAGVSATYKIIFQNGAEVTLDAVRLGWFHDLNGKVWPKFEAQYENGGQWHGVAFNGKGRYLDPADILGIFRMREFGNGFWPDKLP